MSYNIMFNNQNNYDMGLYVVRRPNIPIPKKKYATYSIPGRNGLLTRDLGTYEDIKISIEFNFVDRFNFVDKCDYVKAWLYSFTDNKLILSEDSDRYYIVKQIIPDENIYRSLKVKGYFKVDFICEPFKNGKTDASNAKYANLTYIYQPFTRITNSSFINPLQFYNPTSLTLYDKNTIALEEVSNFKLKDMIENNPSFYMDAQIIKNLNTMTLNGVKQIYNNSNTISKPLIKLYGTGNLQLFIGSQQLIVNNVTNYIVIDSALEQIKDYNNNNKSSDMIGKFPNLAVGYNNIDSSSNVSKIEIQCNSNWI